MDSETKALFSTIVFFAFLAAPWIYVYAPKVFAFIMLILLAILALTVAVVLFFLVYSIFEFWFD